jgi:hypothetical protein
MRPTEDKEKQLREKENHRRYMKEVWYPKNREKHKALVAANKQKPEVQERSRRNAKANRAKVRAWVVEQYGGRCSCPNCPETNTKFLTLDHINNDGNQHRKIVKHAIYTWAKTNNCPPTLRLLCWNCNSGRQYNGGICPHEEIGG